MAKRAHPATNTGPPGRAWPLKSSPVGSVRLCQHTFPSEGSGGARLLIFVAIVVIVATIVQPASAHTTEELDEYVDEWINTALEVGVTVEAFADWTDMAQRHPAYFGRPAPSRKARTTHAPNPVTTGAVSAGVEQWRSLVVAYFSADKVETALRIMACESGGNPNALGRDGDSGLFQHLQRYWTERSSKAGWAGASIWDPTANVAVAAWLQRTGGWRHWTCY